MSIHLSPQIQARLVARAKAEGLSVDALIERLIEEREEFAATLERAEAHFVPFSREDIQVKIERGFAQSERGEVVDGETFTAGLLSELGEIERKRHIG
jgi:predicted transcriptional regulator